MQAAFGAVAQARLDPGCVVHLHALHLACPRRDRSLVDKCACGTVKRFNLTEQVAEEIDGMRADVNQGATARSLFAQPPAHRARWILVTAVQIVDAKRVYLSQLTGAEDLVGAQDGGKEAIVEGHTHLHACRLCNPHQVACLGGVQRQRLIAVDVLAGK